MSKSEWTLIKKDIHELLGSKQVLLPMIIVPLMFVVLFPLGLLIGASFVGETSDVFNEIDPLLQQLPFDYTAYNSAQLLIKITIDYFFPSFFLIIPIMSSGVIGASSFVGEKEHHTMESLLYTPISMEQLLRAKILGVFIPAYALTLLSFILFAVTINIGGFIYFGGLIFPNVKWLLIIGWVSPFVCLLSLIFTVMVSAKATTFEGAQQISGLLVLPIVLLIVGQMTGLFLLSNGLLLIIGGVLLLVDVGLMKRVAATFRPEKLI